MHNAANILWREGTYAAKQWSKHLKDELWEGRGNAARDMVGADLSKVGSPAKLAALQKLETYLEHNRCCIDYPRSRALDLVQ